MSGVGDMINNPEVRLDNNIIADILGRFLQLDMWSQSFVLSEFRLDALYARACGFKLGPRIVTADVLESLGSLYAIALFYAMCPSLHRVDRKHMSLLQSVMCECLVVMDKKAPLSLSHPGNQMMYWNNVLIGKYFMVQTFADALDAIKDIVRDVARQVRNGRERATGNDSIKGKKRIYLSDCMKEHSIYLLCVFGLVHVSIVAISQTSVEVYPGMFESASVALVCARTTKSRWPTPDEEEGSSSVIHHMMTKATEPDRSALCLELASQLGFLVVKAIDPDALKQITLVKGRMSRRVAHPKAAFANTKVSEYRALVKYPLHTTHPHLSVRNMNVKELKELKTKSPSTFAATIFSSGRVIPPDFLLGLSQVHSQKEARNLDEPYLEPGPDSGQLTALISAGGASKVTPPSTASDKPAIDPISIGPQERSDYWALHERVRPAFVVTRQLRAPVWRCSIAEDYVFRKKNEPLFQSERGLASLSANQSSFTAELDRVESLYTDLGDEDEYRKWASESKKKQKLLQQQQVAPIIKQSGHGHEMTALHSPVAAVTEVAPIKSDKIVIETTLSAPEYQRMHLPRFLDPTEGMYWLCIVLGEYIERELSTGRIFRADDGAALPQGMAPSALREELKRLKSQRLRKAGASALQPLPLNSGYERNTPQSASNRPSGQSSRSHNVAARNEGGSKPSSAERSSRKPTTDLEFKLLLAKKEAALEVRCGNNEGTSKTMNKNAADSLLLMDDPLRCAPNGKGPACPILMEALSSPVFISAATGQTRKGIISDSEWNKLKYFGEVVELSVVWRQQRMKEDDHLKEAARISEKQAKLARAKRLDPKAYLAEIANYKASLKAQEEDHKIKLEDMAENITGMLRTYKSVQVKEMKEARKRDAADSIAIKDKIARMEKEAKQASKLDRQREEEARILEEEKEIFRIRAIKNRKRAAEEKEAELRLQREKKEKLRLREMADKAEHEEIIKRMQEEDRMKYLEGLQRDREKRVDRAAMRKQEEFFKKRQLLRQTKQKVTKIVRKGNFMWHNGKYGFYKDARPTDVPYIQYEDEYETPYYYDPISNSSSYDMPADAPIIHHTDKEREEFDAENGEGEYDKLMEQRRFKDQCNRDGGYYSKTGVWLALNGYYDENYMFVSY